MDEKSSKTPEEDSQEFELELELPEEEIKLNETFPDEYAPLKQDFTRIIDQGLKSFQESAPGREINSIIVRLQGRYGIIVQTNERGLVSMPEMSGVEINNQGEEKIQRMFMGLNCSSSTKATAFTSVNLLKTGQTSIKEFETNSAAHEMVKKCIEKSQRSGERVQKQIDEDNHQWYPRTETDSENKASFSTDTRIPIPTDDVFKLVSLARETTKRALGKKLEECNVIFFNINDSTELSDSSGNELDTVVSRTGFAIEAKTDKGNTISKFIRGTGGLEVLKRFSPEKSYEEIIIDLANQTTQDCIDTDRAQSAAVLAGEADVILGPDVVGVLAHEVYGHTSECDIILQNKHDDSIDLSLKARLGGQVSENPAFHIIDDGGFDVKLGNIFITNCHGAIPYDDEATEGKRTYLIKNGIQQLALNSADTYNEILSGLPDKVAEEMKSHGLTGNLRSQRFDTAPMIRMTNTFILPNEEGPDSIEELAALIPSNKKGVYVKDCAGGWVDTTTGEFEVTGKLGYLVENGTITDKPVKNIVISGNITKFGSKIKEIGSSKTITHTFTDFCGKNSSWVPVEAGGPAILVENSSIGRSTKRYFAEVYSEYARQMEEVRCGRRKLSDVYIKQIDDATDGKINQHSNLCLVASCLPIEKEIQLITGRDRVKSDYVLKTEGQLVEDEHE